MGWNRHLSLARWVALALVVAFTFVARPVRVSGQSAGAPSAAHVSFTKDIAPILQRSCQSCHRPGSVAPMSLLTYEEVRPWARAMKHRTGLESRPDVMPPWFIDKTIGIQQFKDDMSLSEAEIAKIAAWVDAGAPRGNPADMPAPLNFGDGKEWRLGKPDLIVRSPTFEVARVQPDWWGSIGSASTGLTEDRYVASVEFKEVTESVEPANIEGPGGRRQTVGGQAIVHHAAYSPRVLGDKSAPNDEGEIGADVGFTWPVHEVGRNPDVFDPEAGKLLRARSEILFSSVHLHANGRHTKAHLEMGFKFHPKGYQPTRTVKVLYVHTRDIDLNGNEANQRAEGFLVLKENWRLTIFEPHMHAAGVRQCLDAIWANTYETLNCAGYNHSWVRIYTYADDAQPLLPKGTILRLTNYFDTTAANKNISDIRNWQGLGNRSVDNMAIAVITGVPLTDAEFEEAVAKRRERLRLNSQTTVIGCPLCGHQKKAADSVARVQ